MVLQLGIATTWEQPPADSLEAHVMDLSDAAGSSLRSGDRSCLVVRIAPDVPPGAYQDALGFGVPFARYGIDVEAVYRRIESQAESAGVAAEVVLAYVVAHEIGHVLLRSSQHASTGIMRAHCCDKENWRLVSVGMVAFSPDEAKQMRAGLWRFKAREQKPAPTQESCPLWAAANSCAMSKRLSAF
jgi:hypothetical protein